MSTMMALIHVGYQIDHLSVAQRVWTKQCQNLDSSSSVCCVKAQS